MRIACLVAAVLAAVAAGCGGSDPVAGEPVPSSTPAVASTIYSLGIDPGDGTMLLSVGPFTHRLAPGATRFEQIEATLREAPVKDLVVRFTGPGELIGSGHGLRPPLPRNLGLIRSGDGGMTWESVSGFDEADYHEIEHSGETVVGLRSDSRGVRVSRDGGKTFETREPPVDSPPIDVAIDPADTDHLALSSRQGVFLSTNGGGSWRQRDTTSATRLAWAKPDALFSAGLDGTVRVSADGGRSWEQAGKLDGGPKEFVVGPEGDLYAVMDGGEVRRSVDGGATWATAAGLSG